VHAACGLTFTNAAIVKSRCTFVAVTMPSYWRPRSEADIRRVIDDALLCETHHLDCKRQIGGTPGERKETARDLSSFAIDGGALLIGVDEDKNNRAFSLAPQQLTGVVERVEDIAGTIIDPPLDVTPYVIMSERQPGCGYLLVEVASSPFAPHMVDGVYYGRGEKKRIRLTDAQVLRYHAQRVAVEERTHHMLDAEIARDPVPDEVRKLGHLYLVARPLTAPPTVARSLVREAGPVPLKQIARAAEQHLGRWARQPPEVTDATRFHPRARGVALSSLYASGPGRTFSNHDPSAERNVVDIEFGEDASIRAIVGGATYEHGPGYLLISDALIVTYAVRLVGWAAAIGRAVGYHGSWSLGLHASELRGLPGVMAAQTYTEAPRFNEDCHRAVTTATLADLEERWQQVAGELVGGLIFALGTVSETFAELVTW
jgi:hypothetical protein